MEIKQEPLSLPPPSPPTLLIPNVLNTNDSIMTMLPFAQYHDESNVKAESEGMECNYRVTNDDRAWNSFLKKGQFIESGEFRSVTSRAGTKCSKKIQDEYKQTSTTSSTQNQHFQISKTLPMAEQIAQEIMIDIKTSIENAIELANTQIATESHHEKTA
ncbi:unnamed protein product [Adineta steineri]|uniref:Uncharacterized protein n=1 Tax=Adineta steineri TaxID=433720 RepID=A0A815RR95_9BILA|nr:unnamed protein product [Adineta steineri]CAF1481658.1 unnamed protein product [Adineta steineri]CAF1618513.1 unnamed protein product [Adineta steineri]CAF1618557.1 unnamed protein product [Adineta steineri]